PRPDSRDGTPQSCCAHRSKDRIPAQRDVVPLQPPQGWTKAAIGQEGTTWAFSWLMSLLLYRANCVSRCFSQPCFRLGKHMAPIHPSTPISDPSSRCCFCHFFRLFSNSLAWAERRLPSGAASARSRSIVSKRAESSDHVLSIFPRRSFKAACWSAFRLSRKAWWWLCIP